MFFISFFFLFLICFNAELSSYRDLQRTDLFCKVEISTVVNNERSEI